MGTNFYRVPKSHSIVERVQQLNLDIAEMDIWSAQNAKNEFRIIAETEYSYLTPWDKFIGEMSVHLGKRSLGWKFLWNFHHNKHYSNKKELLEFVGSGRVVDEYGMEISPEEFIKMALEWGQPDGAVVGQAEVDRMKKEYPAYISLGPDSFDRDVDGLRVCSTIDFS